MWKVTNEWRQIAETNNVDLQVDIKARGLKVRGDIQRLSWALGGVMDNALKYTPTGGTIVIQASSRKMAPSRSACATAASASSVKNCRTSSPVSIAARLLPKMAGRSRFQAWGRGWR